MPDRGAGLKPGVPKSVILLASLALAAAIASAVLSAAIRAPALEAALAAIDAALSGPSPADAKARFDSAYRLASSSGDWLSILKRARKAEIGGDKGRYASAASKALRKEPGSEPIRAAAAHAFLRGGMPREALALFGGSPAGSSASRKGGSLSPEKRPALWAEAFLRSRLTAEATARDYARLAAILDDGTPYLGASVLSMAEGDIAAAKYWVGRAMESGARPSADLLWDCSLYEALSRRESGAADARELAILGDAAWKTKDSSLARERWMLSVAAEPRRSWKPYASLALSSDDEESSVSYWSRMRAAFLSGPKGEARDGALGAYAAMLSRSGRDAEALELLGDAEGDEGSGGALLALRWAVRAKSEPEARIAAGYASLAELYPRSPEVLGSRLRFLAERGFAEELVQTYESAERRGTQPRHGWFYGAWILAARGMAKEAAELVSKRGSDESGPAAAFALGSLKADLGFAADAAAHFDRAAALASGGPARAKALKAKGRALQAAGDVAGAARAYRAAALADGSDAEAAVLARALGLDP